MKEMEVIVQQELGSVKILKTREWMTTISTYFNYYLLKPKTKTKTTFYFLSLKCFYHLI